MPSVDNKRPLKVFLCHAHADRDPVRGLYTRLTKDGVDAWLDKEKLLPGQDWELEIRKAVREADVVVVCLSKQFNQAGFRQKEVRLALDTAMEKPEGEIFIVPARLEECDTLESLRKWHWVDLFEESGYRRLMLAFNEKSKRIGALFKLQKQHSVFTSSDKLFVKKVVAELEKQKEEEITSYWGKFVAILHRVVSLETEKLQLNIPRKSNTAIIVALIGLAGIIVVGLLSLPLIEKWLSSRTVNVPLEPQLVCVSSTPETNPYLSYSQSNAVKIYENYKLGSVNYDTASQDALSGLGKNTEYRSDFVNVALDDTQMIRIMVTYLDPILIQYIVLDHELSSPDNSKDLAAFNNQLKTLMNKLGERNEILFVVTVTSPVIGHVLNVRLPIEQLTLIGADVRVTPVHGDHILGENIDIAHGPVSGIVGYPVALMNQNQCVWVVDQLTNYLTLDIPSFVLGGNQFAVQFWNIPFSPAFDPYTDSTQNDVFKSPPTPNWKPNGQIVDDTNWKIYWEEMGRYLWYFLNKNGLIS